MNFQERYSSYLMHHGIKGMKWGVWNDETKARYAGGSGKNFSDKDWKKAGFKSYPELPDYYEKTVKTNKNTTGYISITKNDAYIKNKLSDSELVALSENAAKNFDKYSDIFNDKIADYLVDEKTDTSPWLFDSTFLKNRGFLDNPFKTMSKDQKKSYLKKILGQGTNDFDTRDINRGKGYTQFNIYEDRTAEYTVTDGGAFFGHDLSFYFDMKQPDINVVKIRSLSVEG